MFVEIYVEGLKDPFLLPVGKLSSIGKQLEARGKKWKYGKTYS